MTISALLICSALAGGVAIEGEETMKEMRSKFIDHVFNEFDKDSMYLLDEFYAKDVEFEDPVNRLEGLDALRAYYAKMYENVLSIAFDITNEVVEGDTHVIMWTMDMTVDKFNKGKPVLTHGTSVIRFNEDSKVIYHRDYFDMGEMLYQHVPVLGYMVKKAKAKLEKGERD